MGFKDWWKRLWCRDKYKKPSRPDVPREPVKPVKPIEGRVRWIPKLEPFQIVHLEDYGDNLEFRPETRILNTELSDLTKEFVDKCHASGIRVVAYFSASYEDWRDDASEYPESAKGKKMDDWDELWPQLSNNMLRDFLATRMKRARDMGVDGIEIDNTDTAFNDTGFNETEEENTLALIDLANRCHNLGMAIFLKNTGDLVDRLHPYFDGCFTEQPNQYNEVNKYLPFVENAKPLFIIEYKSKHCNFTKGAITQKKSDYFSKDFKLC